MKLETKALSEALKNLKPILSHRTTLPILSCVKLHTERNRLHITASDLDQFQVERIECDGEIGPVCVGFYHLSNSIGGEGVSIKLGKDLLTIGCDFGTTELATLSAEEFPASPKMEKSKSLGVSCEDLGNAMGLVSWAASDDPTRYNIQSVFISSESKKLQAVSTGGRELALVDLALIGSDFELTVPSGLSGNMAFALSRKGAELSANESWIKVSHESGWYACKQIDGKYPNYRQVIPAKKTLLGEVDAAALKELFGRCLGFSTAKEAKGVFTFSKDGVEVDFIGDNNANLHHRLSGKFSEFKIALNARSIFNSLSHVKNPTVKLYSAGDEFSPITIQAGDLMILTAPMRLS
jgi:DNA polymerase III subunit beta